jgi:hypothetical protein
MIFASLFRKSQEKPQKAFIFLRKTVVVSLCSVSFSAARNSLHALDALDALTTGLRTHHHF